jgi:vacuolar-type H+-ATPase subunit E/Vma4
VRSGLAERAAEDPGAILDGVRAGMEAELARLEEASAALEKAKLAEAEARAKELAAESDARLAAQATAISAAAESASALESRKRWLALRGDLVREVEGRARLVLASFVHDASYPGLLRDWIVEAALGLGAEEAIVELSAEERPLVDESLLLSAMAEAKALGGVAVRLSKSEGGGGQGVRLVAADGRRAFDNRVEARFRRRRAAIERLVQEELFGGSADAASANRGSHG